MEMWRATKFPIAILTPVKLNIKNKYELTIYSLLEEEMSWLRIKKKCESKKK